MRRIARCSCCGRPLESPVRFCRKCKRPILRHDTWKITPKGLEHKCCTNPTHYMSKEEYRKVYGREPY